MLQATLARPCAGQGQRRSTAAHPSGSFPVLRTTPTSGKLHGGASPHSTEKACHAVLTGNQCSWESSGIPLLKDCSDVRRVCLGLALFKDEFKRFLYFKQHVWKLHKQSISYIYIYLDLGCSNNVFTSSPTLGVENMFSFRVDSQHTSAWYLSSLLSLLELVWSTWQTVQVKHLDSFILESLVFKQFWG